MRGMPEQPARLRTDGVAWRAVDGHVVVLDLRSSEYLHVNEAGSLLFEHLAEGADAARLGALLVERYGIGADQAARDVAAFLGMLGDLGLLEPSEITTSAGD